MTQHELKVQAPYFEPLFEEDKTFEVRRNDRAYQRGDTLRLREWRQGEYDHKDCNPTTCRKAWYTGRECLRRVTFVYSGDPRWSGIEHGYVVLALANDGGEVDG